MCLFVLLILDMLNTAKYLGMAVEFSIYAKNYPPVIMVQVTIKLALHIAFCFLELRVFSHKTWYLLKIAYGLKLLQIVIAICQLVTDRTR